MVMVRLVQLSPENCYVRLIMIFCSTLLTAGSEQYLTVYFYENRVGELLVMYYDRNSRKVQAGQESCISTENTLKNNL